MPGPSSVTLRRYDKTVITRTAEVTYRRRGGTAVARDQGTSRSRREADDLRHDHPRTTPVLREAAHGRTRLVEAGSSIEAAIAAVAFGRSPSDRTYPAVVASPAWPTYLAMSLRSRPGVQHGHGRTSTGVRRDAVRVEARSRCRTSHRLRRRLSVDQAAALVGEHQRDRASFVRVRGDRV